jgi:hypothetical protein
MTNSGLSRNRRGERGITIILVAVTMLFMIIALAAIAIDIVALYTARSQAGHAADAAAMAGAKTLANSGLTSDPTNVTLQTAAQTLATQIAKSVATQSKIQGQPVVPGQVAVTFPNAGQPSFVVRPQVSVTVERTDLPTFFARAAGRSIVAVGSTSVAEAFNPSSSSTMSFGGAPIPIAPHCVKPWILPNVDPTNGGAPFFDAASGAILSPLGTIGKTINLVPACPTDTGCPASWPPPAAPVGPSPPYGVFYYADFFAPAATSLPASCGLSGCAYEQSIAACSPQPISCGVVATVQNIDTGACGTGYWNKTISATQCMIHGPLPGSDTLAVAGNPAFTPPLSQPLQFIAGDNNPLVGSGAVAAGDQVSTSDSLVTIPVYTGSAGTTVNITGFVQGFVTRVVAAPTPPSPPTPVGAPNISVVIVNLSGCGTGATAPPVLGDGISPVPVHLISQ